jgi:hypothetical protein
VGTVDEAIELLTGLPAGAPAAAGRYPGDSINGRVSARLAELAEKIVHFGAGRETTIVHAEGPAKPGEPAPPKPPPAA